MSHCKKSNENEKDKGEQYIELSCAFKGNDTNTLNNYTEWLGRRKQIHSRLGTALKRQSGELLMNIADGLREIQEEKEALEYTKIPQHFDKYRGNPAWFELPIGLKSLCWPCSDIITHFYVQTKIQKNEIPLIERVGIPSYIQNEKMLLPRTRSLNQLWNNSRYRSKRMEELSSLLAKIIPHKPQFENLIIIGNKMMVPGGESSSDIKIGKVEQNVPDTLSNIYDRSLRVCLKINDTFFYEDAETLKTASKIYISLDYDVISSPLVTKFITFENVGRITLRIYWRKHEKFKLFRDIPKRVNEMAFYFDKNEIVLIPGRVLNFPIWFQTQKLGYVMETWEITTIPKMWAEPIHILFFLQAHTYIKGFLEKVNIIKQNIATKVQRRVIKETLDDCLIKCKYEQYQNVDYSYVEAELFEAANLDDKDLELHPKYLYNEGAVSKLKEFYKTVRHAHLPERWNLSIKDLQIIVRVQDILCYAEEKTNQYRQYRQKQKEIAIALAAARKPKDAKSKTSKKGKKGKKGKGSSSSGKSKKGKKDKGSSSSGKSKKGKKDKGSSSSGKSKKGKKGKGSSSSGKSKKGKHSTSSKKSKSSAGEVSDDKKPFTLKETNYGKLMKLLCKLPRPNINVNKERTKYFYAYSIFCAYFTQISSELSLLPTQNATFPINSSATSIIPERLIFEQFDDLQFVGTKRAIPEGKLKAKPKPEELKNIPINDTEKIFNTYFGMEPKGKNKPGKKSKKGKGGKSGKKNKKKDKKKDKKKGKDGSKKSKKKDKKKHKKKGKDGKKHKSKGDPKEVVINEADLVNLDFDPYSEEYAPPIKNKNVPVSNIDKVSSSIQISAPYSDSQLTLNQNQKHYMYVLMYYYLGEAIGAVVDMLESFKLYEESHKNLGYLQMCYKMFADEEEGSVVKELDKATDTLPQKFKTDEDKQYFEAVLQSHLNDLTQKYIIEKQTNYSLKETPNESLWSVFQPPYVIPKVEIVESISEVSGFSTPRIEPDEIGFVEDAVQTVEEEKEIMEEVLGEVESICACPSEFRFVPDREDKFYYSDDEVFDESPKGSCDEVTNISKPTEGI